MNQKIRVFYDGTCGLCHSFVRFILSRKMNVELFIFSPQQGTSFAKLLKIKEKAPSDSIVVYDPVEQKCLEKGEAIIFILHILGKPWSFLAYLLKIFPLWLVNIGYGIVAKIRHKIFKKPKELCPLIPSNLKQFFED